MTKAPINIFTFFGSIAISLIAFLGIGMMNSAEATTLNLYCNSATSSSIEVEYDITDASDANLYLGTDLLFALGAGDHSGYHNETGLDTGTAYTFNLEDGGLSGSVTCVTADVDDPDPDPDPVGTLSCGTTTANSIQLNYTTTDATDAHLFMGSTSVLSIGAGDDSGSHTEDGLDESTTYTFYLRDGDDTDDDLLDSVSCTTDDEDDEDDPVGSLECEDTTEDSIEVYYETEDGSDVHIFRGSTRIYDIGWGDESGTYTDDDLDEDTTYTFYLRNGDDTDDDLLDSVSCTTDDEDDEDDPVGSLECEDTTEDSIEVYYETEDGSDVHIFRGSTRIYDIGWGDESGTYTDDDLDEDTTYTFYLRNGDDTDDDLLDSVSCTTDDEDDEDGEISVTKKVKREGSSTYYNSLNVSPGELLTYSIEVEAEDEDLEDVFVRDELSSRIIYKRNLKVDGDSVSGDIEDGIDIGDIDEGESKTITFDVEVASKSDFLIGTTSITNVANVSADNASSNTDSATINVERESKVTEVVTGITGNSFFDYFLIPLLIASIIFVLFRKQITSYIGKIEKGFLKAKEELI
jgi:hypothetical protein